MTFIAQDRIVLLFQSEGDKLLIFQGTVLMGISATHLSPDSFWGPMVDLLQRMDHCTPPQLSPPPLADGGMEVLQVLAGSQQVGVGEEGCLRLETREGS